MAIGPVVINGTVSRLQDISSVKQNEDNKVLVDQNNFQTQFHKQIDNRLNQVHSSDNAENYQKKYDAKEKGNGSYEGDGGKKRDKKPLPKDGKVVPKGYGGFDLKV